MLSSSAKSNSTYAPSRWTSSLLTTTRKWLLNSSNWTKRRTSSRKMTDALVVPQMEAWRPLIACQMLRSTTMITITIRRNWSRVSMIWRIASSWIRSTCAASTSSRSMSLFTGTRSSEYCTRKRRYIPTAYKRQFRRWRPRSTSRILGGLTERNLARIVQRPTQGTRLVGAPPTSAAPT